MKKVIILIAALGLMLQAVGCNYGDYEVPHNPRPAANAQSAPKGQD